MADQQNNQDEMAKVMGFSNFGGEKKAKQFDFMAMFEETRKSAIERSRDTLSSRDESAATEEVSKAIEEDDEGLMGPPLPVSSTSSKAQTSVTKKTETDSDDSSDDEEDMIGPPIPKAKGKRPWKNVGNDGGRDDSDEDDDMIGPPLPGGVMKKDVSKGKMSDSDEEEEDEDNPLQKIPKSHEITLKHSDKTVSALALDPAGARLVTGSYDYEVRFWDFAGMNASLQSFRHVKPCESHQIRALDYSNSGENILVVAGNAQAKILDRDGYELFECVKGYQYIVDTASTKGHTGMLNDGCWHPKDRSEFMTCSIDGSVRLWDVNQRGKNHKGIMKPRSVGGRKTFPTACCYSRDGRWIAAACQDGSIQIWDHNKHTFVNVAMQNKTAHQNGTDTSSLCFSYDGKTLASRGGPGDDTLKLWDIRNFKNPLGVANDLENLFPMTDCLFSPDDKLVLTGTSVKRGTGVGKVVFFDRDTMKLVHELQVTEGESVVRCIWHPKLNQMVVGTGDGSAKMYYDPNKSHRGAMLCVVKKKRKIKQIEAMVNQAIVTPYALRMYREAKPQGSRRRLEKERADPIKSHRPDLPHTGPGKGGRMSEKGATLSQYIVQQIVLTKPDDRDKDPRAAILRHADEAAKNPFYVEPAYNEAQPKIFAPDDSNIIKNVDDEDIQPVWKKAKKKE